MHSNGFAITSYRLGERAVVIGGGISGLAAAQALADFFGEVVLLERDQLPSDVAPRPGAPQGKQAHGLLAGAIKALEELFPGFTEDLIRAGAVPIDAGCEVSMEIPGLAPFPKDKWEWRIYSLSRPLIELVLRRRVEQRSGITLRTQCNAVEITGTADGALVTGVQYQAADGRYWKLSADLVIDASKHGALTLSYLKSTGRPEPEETTIGVEIRYATAIFSVPDGALGEFKGIVTFPKAPEDVRYGYLLPMENSFYQLLLVGRGEDAPPADEDGFLAYAQKLSTPTIHNAMKGAKRVSEIARYGFPESKWRHFGRLNDFPRRLLPVGDAICCLNPIYGQGMTLAIQEASALRQLLSAHAEFKNPLATLSEAFRAKAEAMIEDPWSISAIPDFVYPQTRGERPEDLEQKLKSDGALARLATRDSALYKLFSEVRHLLRPLSALKEPEVARKIEAEMEEMAEEQRLVAS